MMGMNRQETLATPYGEMSDMVSCLAIYNGRAEEQPRRRVYTFDEAIALR